MTLARRKVAYSSKPIHLSLPSAKILLEWGWRHRVHLRSQLLYSGGWDRRTVWAQEFEGSLGNRARFCRKKKKRERMIGRGNLVAQWPYVFPKDGVHNTPHPTHFCFALPRSRGIFLCMGSVSLRPCNSLRSNHCIRLSRGKVGGCTN